MTLQYDSNGIITQTLTEIIEERETNLQPVMGDDFTIDKTTPIGNMELADANSELNIHELIAWLIPNQLDANTATGYFLDCICEKNRIYRKQPQYTEVDLIINGTSGTSFSAGDIIVYESISTMLYDLKNDTTIGDDGTVVARFVCETFGDNEILSTSTFTIQTPMSGLTSVTLDYDNMDLSIGRYTETDNELRRRRELSVAQTSTNTLLSMSSVINSIDGVNFVKYIENDTESTDANGVPMKSFEFVVDGGDSEEITDAIFNNKPIGTRAYGTVSVEKEDDQGNLYNISYTPATKINLGMKIDITTSSLQAESWKDSIKDSIIELFDSTQTINLDVKGYTYYSILTNESVVTDIDSIQFYKLDEESPVYYSRYKIGTREIPKLEKENITINVTAG